MKENNSNNLSRRDFLKFTGALVAGAALSQISSSEVSAQENNTSPETESTSGWGNIPVVKGEIYQIEQQESQGKSFFEVNPGVNMRSKPTTNSESALAEETTYLELFPGEEKIADESGGPYQWAHGKVIKGTIPEFASEEGGVYAAYIQGTRLINDTKELPEDLQAQYTQAPAPSAEGLTLNSAVFDSAELTRVLGSSIGGTTTLTESLAYAWGKEYQEGQNSFNNTGVEVWQQAVALVAQAAPVEKADGTMETASRAVDICSIFGSENPNSCNFYRQENENGSIDVIQRMNNQADKINPDLFGITRFTPDQDGKLMVHGVGFLTPNGLQVAYKDQAQTIADGTSAVTGEDSVTLAQEMSQLSQGKVFLAGMPLDQQFADRLDIKPLLLPQDLRESIEKEQIVVHDGYKKSQFSDGRPYYQAFHHIQDKETGSTRVFDESLLTSETAQWINMPDSQLLQDIGLNSIENGNLLIDVKNTPKFGNQGEGEINATVLTLINKDTNTAVMAVPEKGIWKWGQEGLGPKFQRKTGIDFGFAVSHYNSKQVLGSPEGKNFIDFNATVVTPESQAEGRNLILGLQHDGEKWNINFNFDHLDGVIKYAQAAGKKVYIHPLIDTDPERLGRVETTTRTDIQNLNNNAGLQEEMRVKYLDLARQLITELHGRYDGVADAYTLLNETRQRPNNMWRTLIGQDYMERIFEMANEVDPNMEWVWNEWLRWDDQVQENSGDFLNSFANEIIRLKSQGVNIKNVGLQSHLSTRDWTDIPSAFRTFFNKMAQNDVSVRVTELDWSDVHDDSVQVQQGVGILRAAKDINAQYGEEVVKGITVWGYKDNHSWLYQNGNADKKDPLLIDEEGQPKQVYNAMLEEAK